MLIGCSNKPSLETNLPVDGEKVNEGTISDNSPWHIKAYLKELTSN